MTLEGPFQSKLFYDLGHLYNLICTHLSLQAEYFDAAGQLLKIYK